MKIADFIIVCLLVTALGATVQATIIEVSQSTALTTNGEYDRNPSIVHDGTNYWLFYTKGDDVSTSGVRGSYNPDADSYVVYYKSAGTIAGLAGASETKLALSESARPANFDQRVCSAVVVGSDIYVIVSSGQSGTDRGMYYYKYSGASWSGPVTIIADATARGGHVNAVSDGTTIYIVWESSADASSDFYTYEPVTPTLSAKYDISNDNQPKITLLGSTLYVVSIQDGTGDIEVYSSDKSTISWSAHSTAIAGAGLYDPCIFNDGTDLYVVTAPYDGGNDQQYLVQTKGTTAGVWATEKQVSLGGYSGSYWWDYWPVGYHDGTDAYVLFTTETGSPTYSDGEIAMVKMDWDLANDHYFYIQNAIDQAAAGDTINVAAGTYTEQLSVTGKGLTIRGASESGVIVQAAAAQTGSANVFTINASGYDVTLEKMTIRHGDYGIRSSAGNVSVLNCTLYNNGYNGAALPVTIDAASMAAWWAANATDGGAIRIQDSAVSEIANCTVYDNDRGIRYQDGANGEIHNNVVHNNIQAGIYLAASSYTGATGCSNTNVYDNESYANLEHGLLSIGGINNTCTNNNLYDNWNCGVMLWHPADIIVLNNTIDNNNLYAFNGVGNPADGAGAVYAVGDNNDAAATFVFKLCGNTITNNNNGTAGQAVGVSVNTPLPADGIEIKGNTFYGHDVDIHVRSQAAATIVNYNSLGVSSIGIQNDDVDTLDAEDNWWGTLESSLISGMVSANVDYDPILPTSQIHLAWAGARLVDIQNNDGGWDWDPADDGDSTNASPQNTIGPIGMGLAKAYKATGDTDMYAALQKVSTFLLAKINTFSPPDGYLARELDDIMGGTTHVDHVDSYFYGQLAAGTYNRNGAGTLYSTASYVQLIRDARAGQGIPNLAAWDIGMGLAGAAACNADTGPWIAGAKAEIDELGDVEDDYEVIGLAGALYGLAYVGEEFDPTGGMFASAGSLADLADSLTDFQISSSGGFTWDLDNVSAGFEDAQTTAYAVLALNEVGGHKSEIVNAIEYLQSAQMCTGGWGGSGENNEVTAESMWALSLGNLLELIADDASLYVQTGENVVIDMDISNLLQKVNGCQAILNFSSTYFLTGGSDVTVAAGGGAWDLVIWQIWDTGGDLDMAIGVDAQGAIGTDVDGTVAVVTLTAGATEGTTQVVFREDVSDVESTWLADMNAQAVIPNKINSQTIVIDGTDPAVEVTSPNGSENLMGGGTWNITWTASDTYIDPNSVQIEYYDGSAWQTIATGENNDGSYDWNPVPSLDINNSLVRVTVSDLAGNSNSDESDAVFIIDSTDPTVVDIAATQSGGSDLTPSGTAIQGVVNIAVATSDNLSGVAGPPTVTVTPNGGSAEAAAYVDESPSGTFNYTWSVTSTTPNGQAVITVSGLTDNAGNVLPDVTDTFNVNKNQIGGNVELEGYVGSSRDVTFVATGGATKSWTLTLSFAGGIGSYTLTDVPEGTTNLSAKAAWNLRTKLAAALDVDGQASADFIDADKLRGGDINGTNSINILDYSLLKISWYTAGGSNDPVADISGDGQVNGNDYILMKGNWFQTGDPQ